MQPNDRTENLHIYRYNQVAVSFEHTALNEKRRLNIDICKYTANKPNWKDKYTVVCDLPMLIQMYYVIKHRKGNLSFERCGADRNKLFRFGWNKGNFYVGITMPDGSGHTTKALKLTVPDSEMDLLMIRHFVLASLTLTYNSMMHTNLSPIEVDSMLQQDEKYYAPQIADDVTAAQ